MAIQQAGVIAFRRGPQGPEVCLIRRKNSGRWAIPKGLIDPGDTVGQTALNEALEEAGLRGRLLMDAPIGTYERGKVETRLTVAVCIMEVEHEEPSWQEEGFRERRWASFAEAADMLAGHPALFLLERARVLLGEPIGRYKG